MSDNIAKAFPDHHPEKVEIDLADVLDVPEVVHVGFLQFFETDVVYRADQVVPFVTSCSVAGHVETAGNEVHFHAEPDTKRLLPIAVVALLQAADIGDIIILFVGTHRIALPFGVQHPVAMVGNAKITQPQSNGAFDVGFLRADGVAAAGGMGMEIDQVTHDGLRRLGKKRAGERKTRRVNRL